jgi:dipeptidyl-peptidase-4
MADLHKFHEPQASFPIEEVAKLPLPGTAIPGELAFSPDGRFVTYLYSPERSLVRQLYAFDSQTGGHSLLIAPPQGGTTEENVTLEEALRRERQRQLELGVTQYAWARNSTRLLIPSQGDLYVCDAPYQPLRKILESAGKPALDARFSPDGEWVAYVQDAELCVVAFVGGEARQLTHGARGTGKTNGLAEFVAQEEMGRRQGFWCSADSRWLAFEEVDETHIPVYRIVHQGKDRVGETAQEDHRYPFSGQPNARVRLGVVPVEGGEPVWMDLGENEDIYLARVGWLPDGRLSAQLENRAQTQLDLVTFDTRTGERTLLLRETSDVWINLHDLFNPLEHPYQGQEGCFLWASERSGFRHLYLYDSQGKLIRQLTAGEWVVDALVKVDEENQQVYFTATQQSPLESHLYVVSFSGGEPRCLTQAAGTHTAVIDQACQRFTDTFHSLEQPPTVALRSLVDGSLITMVYDERDPRVEALTVENSVALRPPELVTLRNRAGTLLYGAIFLPPAHFGKGPFPTIVFVYGGPHAQVASNSWLVTARLRASYLSSLGFLVFSLDNRGSARRGLAFESVIKHNLGHLEVEDQVDGVRRLVEQGLTDPSRVGIIGWSYGGYMAAMCLAQAPETFKVAVAGAPVTHWEGYDTHYTERYMGTPQSNPPGYAMSNVMAHVEKITGKLMLVHGLIDENVHFRHTARLINALIAARIRYELLLFPDERHTPRKLADRVYMEECIRDFFLENL